MAKTGRPKAEDPKVSVTIHVKRSIVEWINANLPRTITRSAFFAEAVDEKIRRMNRR